ncbi:Palmitoylated plasma membrane-bound casein kinase [Neonectria punicea]|uniref:non-specific serine/threonine protein kinase n=1 Tax=Neonectria punicea TaxID=979145 RepID=A0ABR1GH85_9HYPO
MIAKQLLQVIQGLHEHGLIYRDIKPDNFLIGRPETDAANMVHFVDFGLAKRYRDPKTLQHIPYQASKSVCGTLRYMSINSHLGQEQSRRDDLEALGNVFIYFLRGHLPWQGIKAATKRQRNEKISNKKQTIEIEELCKGFGMIFNYFRYVRGLGFDATPDYDYLRGLFSDALRGMGEADDGIYDWSPKADRLNTAEALQEVKRSETEIAQTKRPQTPLEMSHIPKRSLVLSPGQEPRLSKRTSHMGLDERNKLKDSD